MVSSAHDAGLQAERTSLAWNRTALSAAVCALLVVHAGALAHDTALLAVGLVLLAGASATAVTAYRRRTSIPHAIRSGRNPVQARTMRMTAAFSVVVACAVIWSVLAA